jgi:hypothetical protein
MPRQAQTQLSALGGGGTAPNRGYGPRLSAGGWAPVESVASHFRDHAESRDARLAHERAVGCESKKTGDAAWGSPTPPLPRNPTPAPSSAGSRAGQSRLTASNALAEPGGGSGGDAANRNPDCRPRLSGAQQANPSSSTTRFARQARRRDATRRSRRTQFSKRSRRRAAGGVSGTQLYLS